MEDEKKKLEDKVPVSWKSNFYYDGYTSRFKDFHIIWCLYGSWVLNAIPPLQLRKTLLYTKLTYILGMQTKTFSLVLVILNIIARISSSYFCYNLTSILADLILFLVGPFEDMGEGHHSHVGETEIWSPGQNIKPYQELKKIITKKKTVLWDVHTSFA